MSKAYSLHIDDDVAPILDRYKKVAGRPDTRGKYVSRAIRSYEGLLGTEKQLLEQIAAAEQETNEMRTLARTFGMRMHRYLELYSALLEGRETPKRDSGALWFKADRAIQDFLDDYEGVEE